VPRAQKKKRSRGENIVKHIENVKGAHLKAKPTMIPGIRQVGSNVEAAMKNDFAFPLTGSVMYAFFIVPPCGCPALFTWTLSAFRLNYG
jgi:hypothetical protein